MTNRRVLIVGLGIAGMSAAKRLSEVGWTVTLIERAAQRRTGGYFIALFPTGRASAERMGILDQLGTRGRAGSVSWEVSRSGKRSRGMSLATVPEPPNMLLRGDVEDALFNALPEDVSVRYATTPVRIVQDDGGVDVDLRSEASGNETTERFELVLGADGIRSTVRSLVFGPEANFVHDMDYMIAASLLDRDPIGFERGDSVIVSEPGRSATTFAFEDRPPSLLFSYRTKNPRLELARAPISALREVFGPEPTGPVLGELLDMYESAETILFDIAQQVRMRQWHNGRVALIGDAAWCMTLYSGLGASAGIAGGELLGTLLEVHDHDVPATLYHWNERMYPFVHYQHRTIDNSRFVFTSADLRQHLQRKAMMRVMSSPLIQKLSWKNMASSESFRMKALDIGAA